MFTPNYTLDIVSHHEKFNNKSLKKYSVEGIETVGAWGNEPFEIRFKNNTWLKVQVKISLDGTDILTGSLANTNVDGNMWLVNPQETLSLKAWPETNNGGARFVFTDSLAGVAANTHGNLSNRGIIAAAVFVEGHREPIRLNPIWINNYPRFENYKGYDSRSSGEFLGYNGSTTINSNTLGDCDTVTTCDASQPSAASAFPTKQLQSLASVGAGQYVSQNITYVEGLVKPVFTETVRVRYLWWDDLVSKLKEYNIASPHPSGFPGDSKQQIMSIGNTPRIGDNSSKSSKQTFDVGYSRV